MKNTFAILTLFITTTIFAQWGWGSGQAPQGFNYQATVRNNSGQLLLNQIVLVKFTILQDSAKGAIVYSENQSVKTDDLGHINLVVGQGEATVGTFSYINWASGTYYMGIELNTGNGYVEMGTTQLLSVPYALYALNSANSEHSNSADYLNLQPQQSLCDILNNSWNGYESACGHKIQDLSNPTNPQDAATKDYVDTQLQSQITNLQAQITAMQALLSGGTEGQGLTLCDGLPTWTTNGICPGKITSLNCVGVSVNGSLTDGVASSNVSFMINYTGGNGRSYSAQSISSTGVVGLTSTLQAGTFANGNGNLNFTVSGTPTSIGNAIFSLNIGGQLCSVQLSVTQSSYITVKTTVNDIMQSPFVCGGSISALNEKVVERGILYGKSVNLDYNSATTVGSFQYGLSQGGKISGLETGKITSLDGVGEFKVNIMYLFENTRYYYCAYAKTESGKMVKGETLEISMRNFKRDARAPDIANVFWQTNFNLFDLLTDELIQPDANGVYKFYYSSNENPIVTYKELSASQLPNFLFYKFKTKENCLKWTEIKKGILKP